MKQMWQIRGYKFRKPRNQGFTLIELIAIIGVLAILAMIFVPTLMRHTEVTRAGRDVSAMDEVTNAFLVGISNDAAYDEVVANSIPDNIACYLDNGSEVVYKQYLVNTASIGGGVPQYTFTDGARTADETSYYVGGSMRGITITFEPQKKTSGNESCYVLANGIINKYTSATPKKLYEEVNLYNAVKAVIGTEVAIVSQTYRNSEFTVFIRLGTTGGNGAASETTAYGQYSGTNLPNDAEPPRPVTDKITDFTEDEDDGSGNNQSGGEGSGGGSGTDINDSNIKLLGDAYAIYCESDGSLTFIRSTEEVEHGDEYDGKIITEVYTGFETDRYTIDWDSWETTAPWAHRWEEISSVTVKDTIRPQSTACWFFYFENCTSMDLAKLDTRHTTDMSWMFAFLKNVQYLDIAHFDTADVWSMEGMFCGMCSLKEVDVTNFNTTNVTNMGNMFYWCESLTELDLSNFDTWNVKQTHWMFGDCTNLKTIYASSETWLMNNVEVSNDMFNGTINIVGGKGTTYDDYYIWSYYARIDEGDEGARGYLTEKRDGDEDADMSKDAYAIYSEDDNSLTFMRAETVPIVGDYYDGRIISGVYSGFETNVYSFMSAPWYTAKVNNKIYTVRFDDIIKPISTAYWFAGFQYCSYIDLTNLDTSNTRTMAGMFCCTGNSLTQNDTLIITGMGDLDVSKVATMYHMFRYCAERAGGIQLIGIEKWNPSSCRDMSGMFACMATRYYSGDWNLDLSSWDVSNVSDFNEMFYGSFIKASSIQLNLENWDTSSATDMSSMFHNLGYNNGNVTVIGLENFNTSNVTNMECMFSNSFYNVSILPVSNWNTSNVTSMQSMFSYVGSKNVDCTLDLSKWDVSNVTNLGSMFSNCKTMTSVGDISGWDVSSATSTSGMFSNCAALTVLNLCDWDTFNVKNMSSMFYNCSNLTTIYISDWWNVDNVSSHTNMFYKCASMVGQSGVTYSASKVDKSMANYSTGYLTYVNSNTQIPTVNITIDNQCSDQIVVSVPSPAIPSKGYISVVPIDSTKILASFTVNGVKYTGSTLLVPGEDATLVFTDVVLVSPVIFETSHNPYPNNASKSYVHEFEGATSVRVTITYQTHRINYDYIKIFDQNNVCKATYGGTTKKTVTIIIPGDYVKISFKSNATGNGYYGFYAVLTPIYT